MTYPRVAGKHALPAVISPAEHAEYVRLTASSGVPARVSNAVLLYQRSALHRTLARLPGREKDGWISGRLWITGAGSAPSAICGQFGKGAPAAGLVLEQLIALGARQVISLGTAGGLARDLERGSIVVCDRAIRDEGLSYHYLPGTKYCAPSRALTGRLCAALRAGFRKGTSWTTDAPYRETAREVDMYRDENVLTVDMEAAGLFAIGRYRGVHVAAGFAITDRAARFYVPTRSLPEDYNVPYPYAPAPKERIAELLTAYQSAVTAAEAAAANLAGTALAASAPSPVLALARAATADQHDPTTCHPALLAASDRPQRAQHTTTPRPPCRTTPPPPPTSRRATPR